MVGMIPFSVLDLAPIVEGGDVRQALRNSRDLAVQTERFGYHRFWLAEHHNMPGIASSATALCIQNAAAATSTMRIGAGGIMLPNHAPIVIAEQFGTLEALFPGRIDLGLGRAPGGDQRVAMALIICAGAKCEANANGRPSAAANCAPNVDEPKIQSGTFAPSPGTARTICRAAAGASSACNSSTSCGKRSSPPTSVRLSATATR